LIIPKEKSFILVGVLQCKSPASVMFSRKEGMKGSDLVNDVIHLFVKTKHFKIFSEEIKNVEKTIHINNPFDRCGVYLERLRASRNRGASSPRGDRSARSNRSARGD
jgi:hypothetical protein